MLRLRFNLFFLLFLVLAVFSLFNSKAYANGGVPAAQTAGGAEKLQSDIEKSKKLEKKIEEKKVKPKIEEKAKPGVEVPVGEKVLINKINVEGAILLKPVDIAKITKNYEKKELYMQDMQEVADLITDAYRAKGYPTSRAYIPPQTIGKDGLLTIGVVEGKVGDISITGNKYFKSKIYKKKLNLKKNDPFNYSSLQRSLTLINERPDRSAKAVLVLGKIPGTTDIVIEVKDKLPIHLGYANDNYGSRYVGRRRNSVTFEHNNLLGFDDQLYFQFMRSRDSLATLKNGRYLLPLKYGLELGLVGSYARTKLGRDFAALDSVGKSTIIGLFLNQTLISNDSLDLRLSYAFDYKKIRNYISGVETSRDDGRVFKIGFDLDKRTDKFGRTLLTAELDQGIPEIWGGLDATDSRATRVGSGGKFTKGVFNLYHSHPMLLSSSLLLKNTVQLSSNTLVASEEFQVGGPYSVRGYPPAEYAGDKGLYSSVEWAFPYYFVPKKLNVPFTQVKWYDISRFVIFYDWATVRINNPQSTDNKRRTINGAGFGFRFNVNDRLTAKAEFGYPMGGPRSTDTGNQHLQPWVEFTLKY